MEMTPTYTDDRPTTNEADVQGGTSGGVYRDDHDDEEEHFDGFYNATSSSNDDDDDDAIPSTIQRQQQQQRRRQNKNWLLPVLTCIGIVAILTVWGKSASQERTTKKNKSANPTSSQQQQQEEEALQLDPTNEKPKQGNEEEEGIVESHNEDEDAMEESSSIYHCTQPLEECLTDRMGHFQFLHRGQGICNDAHRFGLTHEGALIKETCRDVQNNHHDHAQEHSIVVLHQDPLAMSFQMTDQGHFQLFAEEGDNNNNDTDESSSMVVLWEAIPTISIEPTGQCLSSPRMDCPYLHLHKSGDLVLNSINSNGSWSDRKVRRVFPDLFP